MLVLSYSTLNFGDVAIDVNAKEVFRKFLNEKSCWVKFTCQLR